MRSHAMGVEMVWEKEWEMEWGTILRIRSNNEYLLFTYRLFFSSYGSAEWVEFHLSYEGKIASTGGSESSEVWILGIWLVCRKGRWPPGVDRIFELLQKEAERHPSIPIWVRAYLLPEYQESFIREIETRLYSSAQN